MKERDIQNLKYVCSFDLSFTEPMFEAWCGVTTSAERTCALDLFSELIEAASLKTGMPRTVALGVALAILENIKKENLDITEDEIQ